MKNTIGGTLETFFEQVEGYGVFFVDVDCHVISWSRGALKLTGYIEDEILGKHLDLLYTENDVQRGKLKNDIESAGKEGNILLEGWMQKKDGSTFRAKKEICSIKDEKNEIIHYGIVFSDITELYETAKRDRKEAKRQTKEHDLLKALVDNLPDYIFIKDVDSNFIFSNKAHMDVLNVDSLEELYNKTDFDFFPEEMASAYYGDEQKLVKDNIELSGKEELTIGEDGGEQWLYTTKVPLFSKDGSVSGIAGISRDITDRKKLEEALSKSVKDLERSNKELEQFAYVASHDLQEPLRMVSSFTQLLAQRYKDQLDQDAQEFIHYAVDGANRMQRLINDLLAYSRVQTRAKPFVEVDMHKVLGEVLISLTHPIQESHALITNDDLPLIWADEGQMHQILQNFISNGIKFSKDNPRIHISSQEDDEYWTFSVKDNGIGIESQYFERIFQIFQRLHTKEKYPGTGIGLAICKRIIDIHGGEIHVESVRDEGTTFYFSIKKRRTKQ